MRSLHADTMVLAGVTLYATQIVMFFGFNRSATYSQIFATASEEKDPASMGIQREVCGDFKQASDFSPGWRNRFWENHTGTRQTSLSNTSVKTNLAVKAEI